MRGAPFGFPRLTPAPPPLIESPGGGQMAPGRSVTAIGLYTLSLPPLCATAAENLKGGQLERAGHPPDIKQAPEQFNVRRPRAPGRKAIFKCGRTGSP